MVVNYRHLFLFFLVSFVVLTLYSFISVLALVDLVVVYEKLLNRMNCF